MTREEILAMKPGPDLDALYVKAVLGKDCDCLDILPRYSIWQSLLMEMLREEGKLGDYFGLGLFIAPLNNGQWVCGRAVKIYNIKITDDHYQDKGLVICDTPMEAACKMRLILALCPEEASSHIDRCNHCGDCVHLSITEFQQQRLWKTEKQMTNHVCRKYDRLLMHREYHPLIPRLPICIEEKGYKRTIDPTLDTEGVDGTC